VKIKPKNTKLNSHKSSQKIRTRKSFKNSTLNPKKKKAKKKVKSIQKPLDFQEEDMYFDDEFEQ